MKNLKQWKTTLLGILILAGCAVDLWHFEKLSELALGAIALVGIRLLFAPDNFLKSLNKKTEL